MLKKIFLLASFSILTFLSSAQILKPITWTMTTEQINETEYNLVFTAKAKPPWVVYSQHTKGALPTVITYETKKDIELIGANIEYGHKKEAADKLFDNEVVIKFLSDKSYVIKQKIKITGPDPKVIGFLEYMTCNDTQCIGGLDADFDFKFAKASKTNVKKTKKIVATAPTTTVPSNKIKNHKSKQSTASSNNTNSRIKTTNYATSNTSHNSTTTKKSTSIPTKINSVKFPEKSSSKVSHKDVEPKGGSSFSVNTSKVDLPKENGILEPIKWKMTNEKISETEFDLVFTAMAEKPWVVYSQHTKGASPTIITYETKKDIELVGENKEYGHKKEAADKLFDNEIVIKYLSDKPFVIRQRVKITGPNPQAKGYLEYMTCDDTKCIGGLDSDFDFDFSDYKGASIAAADDTSSAIGEDGSEKEEKKGLFSIFFLALLGGFAALLTPCVFPMIPMTVSFFTKQSKSKADGIKNAIIYGLSIIFIYVLLGLGVTAVFGADALNALSTNVWFNVIFFLLLVFFAVSFLGAFEIVLPSSWANKMDAKADKGGYIGIFFMALALAIVSFSCTGPIVGTLLVESASKGGIAPVIGMLGFSSALAIPFALFAAFPGWLNSLPKSGGWLNSVKVVLGFLELALAFKFLSNADLVLNLHLLEREVFIAIWIVVFGSLALYLFGKLQLPHDSPLDHISVGRLSFGMVIATFTIYMIPGLWGAPLNLISAFPPPQHYSESPYGVGFTKTGGGTASLSSHDNIPEGAHLMPPHDILAFNDYDKGLAYAKKVGKPVMIDFTGHACVNCRKMEQNVWVKPDVLSVLKNDVVLISLYVDDKRKLESDEVIPSKLKPGKNLRYIGQKWSEMQTIKYKTNTQPYYVLMGHDEKDLNIPISYTPNKDTFLKWLKDGVGKF